MDEKEISEFSAGVKNIIKEENSLLETEAESVKHLENSIPEPKEVEVADDEAQEKEAELEAKAEILANNIESTMKNNPSLLNRIKLMANNLMKKFGGPSEVLAKFDVEQSSALPLFMKKKFSFALPPFINLLKTKNINGSNDKLIEKLEAMNTNIQSDVDEATKKGFFARTKDGFRNLTNKLTWKRGGKKRRNKRKTSKNFGGDGETLGAAMLWIGVLILCCMTTFGCVICGPLLIASVCQGLGIECSAGISALANGAASATSAAYNSVPTLFSSSSVANEVGTGVNALNAITQARMSWLLFRNNSNNYSTKIAPIDKKDEQNKPMAAGKRRSKRNKRKSVKKSRTHKK